jgi:hypothetical protein
VLAPHDSSSLTKREAFRKSADTGGGYGQANGSWQMNPSSSRAESATVLPKAPGSGQRAGSCASASSEFLARSALRSEVRNPWLNKNGSWSAAGWFPVGASQKASRLGHLPAPNDLRARVYAA